MLRCQGTRHQAGSECVKPSEFDAPMQKRWQTRAQLNICSGLFGAGAWGTAGAWHACRAWLALAPRPRGRGQGAKRGDAGAPLWRCTLLPLRLSVFFGHVVGWLASWGKCTEKDVRKADHASGAQGLAIAKAGTVQCCVGPWKRESLCSGGGRQGLMDSDVRNLGRLCRFVSSVLPFDPALVQPSGHAISALLFTLCPCCCLATRSVSRQFFQIIPCKHGRKHAKQIYEVNHAITRVAQHPYPYPNPHTAAHRCWTRCGRRCPASSTLRARRG